MGKIGGFDWCVAGNVVGMPGSLKQGGRTAWILICLTELHGWSSTPGHQHQTNLNAT
jgi:hypothetical protein